MPAGREYPALMNRAARTAAAHVPGSGAEIVPIFPRQRPVAQSCRNRAVTEPNVSVLYSVLRLGSLSQVHATMSSSAAQTAAEAHSSPNAEQG